MFSVDTCFAWATLVSAASLYDSKNNLSCFSISLYFFWSRWFECRFFVSMSISICFKYTSWRKYWIICCERRCVTIPCGSNTVDHGPSSRNFQKQIENPEKQIRIKYDLAISFGCVSGSCTIQIETPIKQVVDHALGRTLLEGSKSLSARNLIQCVPGGPWRSLGMFWRSLCQLGEVLGCPWSWEKRPVNNVTPKVIPRRHLFPSTVIWNGNKKHISDISYLYHVLYVSLTMRVVVVHLAFPDASVMSCTTASYTDIYIYLYIYIYIYIYICVYMCMHMIHLGCRRRTNTILRKKEGSAAVAEAIK